MFDLPEEFVTPGRSIATRGGAWTTKPAGTDARGSLSSTRTTSVPPCCCPVTEMIFGSAHAAIGNDNPNAKVSAAPAVQLRIVRFS